MSYEKKKKKRAKPTNMKLKYRKMEKNNVKFWVCNVILDH